MGCHHELFCGVSLPRYELFSKIFNEIFSPWAHYFIENKIRSDVQWGSEELDVREVQELFGIVRLAYDKETGTFVLNRTVSILEGQYPDSALFINDVVDCFLYSEIRVCGFALEILPADIDELTDLEAAGICDLCVFIIREILARKEFLYKSIYMITPYLNEEEESIQYNIL
jgi:hypothetical protein